MVVWSQVRSACKSSEWIRFYGYVLYLFLTPFGVVVSIQFHPVIVYSTCSRHTQSIFCPTLRFPAS